MVTVPSESTVTVAEAITSIIFDYGILSGKSNSVMRDQDVIDV